MTEQTRPPRTGETDIAPPSPNRWLVVAAAGLAVFMAVLDMSIVTVALPVIEHDLDTSTEVTEWTLLAYAVPMVALALPSGRWLDQVGRRPALVLAVSGFGLASVAAGLSQSIEWLIAARAVQGTFGAVLFALVPALAASAVRPEFRGRAMGVIGTLGPLGGFSGPPLGGLLVDRFDWSWIFYVNVPVVVAIAVVALARLGSGARLRWPDRAWLAECLVLGGTVGIVLVALSFGARHSGWLTLALLGVPPLLLWRRMPSSRTVRELFATSGLAAPHLALLLFAIWASALQFIVPFYALRTLQLPIDQAGLTFAAFALAQGALGLAGGALTDRFGAARIGVLGGVIATTGLLLTVPLGTEWTAFDLGWRLVVAGVGGGLFNAANLTLAMSRAPRESLGTVGASTSTVRQLGFGLGPALATTAWSLGGYAVGGMRAAVVLAAAACALTAAVLALPANRG